jgi:transposase-like protein
VFCCSIESLVHFLRQHHVLAESWRCEKCGADCRWDMKKGLWRCDKHTTVSLYGGRKRRYARCNYQKSIFAGTWFEGQRLSIVNICKLTFYWLVLSPPRQQFIMNEIRVASNTVVDWSSFCREVCMYWLEERSEVLGGHGVVVEIDEAKFGRRKYNRGRWIEGQWVFGGFERGSKRCFLVPVPSRTSETLLAAIKKWIAPGSTVVSDCWRAYNCLSTEGFVHLTVNHSYNFVDPNTGAHTQNIERTWREVRGQIPRFGRRREHFVGYLAEFLFKRKFPNHCDRAHAFFTAAGQLYPPSPQ